MATGTIKNTEYSNITSSQTSIVNVEITSYNSASNRYTAPRDGYVIAQASSGTGSIDLYKANMTIDIPASSWGVVFVKKGCLINMVSNISRAFFRAFW